jgi:2-keto-4-pentenoate hydratase
MQSLEELADGFCSAFYEKQWPGDSEPDLAGLSITDSYHVQNLVARKRIARGECVAGFKVGCTSAAIRAQFGLQEPIFGRLFDLHIHEANREIDWTDLVNCAIEPEMVLKIATDLYGRNISDEQLVDSIDYVSPGIELHHFKFWRMPPTTQELICSGGIHAGVVVGKARMQPAQLSFQDELFRVFQDGQEIASAPASEIMGGPLNSLRWLVGSLSEQGIVLKKDSFVIPGSPVELIAVDADTEIRIQIEGVGDLAVHFRQG